ncbi:hypothetical protein T11_9844 [Trichinella zimbabwensis]|uniref:Uncharacterized protein n=1 Tax=Trichinella zimbabwensis TaxID=268475 RepID=A0A0V1HLG3_9BILA|nr:hypothetical protein T11_9844 [Trichinella zimbabwensis]
MFDLTACNNETFSKVVRCGGRGGGGFTFSPAQSRQKCACACTLFACARLLFERFCWVNLHCRRVALLLPLPLLLLLLLLAALRSHQSDLFRLFVPANESYLLALLAFISKASCSALLNTITSFSLSANSSGGVSLREK